ILLRKAVDHDFLDEFPLRKRVIRYKANKPENELSDEERLRFLAAFDDETAFRAMVGARRSAGAAPRTTMSLGVTSTRLAPADASVMRWFGYSDFSCDPYFQIYPPNRGAG